jgi:hypothetical protein
MTADALIRLLRTRHAQDLFVDGCKNGPTQTAGAKVLIMDAWALLSTWSPATCVGYEVKVSRGDWLRDTKWHNYLPLCHLFSLVAPKGLVKPDELPAEVGLIEAIGQGTGTRLVTKRRPVRREIEWPINVLIYVLMSRVTTTTERGLYREPTRAERVESWRRWLAESHEIDTTGRCVSVKLARLYREAVDARRRAEKEVENRDEIRRALVSLGIDPRNATRWRLERDMRASSMATRIESALEQARHATSTLERIHAELTQPMPVDSTEEEVPA